MTQDISYTYTSSELPKTLTIKDITFLTGISRYKWEEGVVNGLFPSPIEGFKKPKRWKTEEVLRCF